MDQEIARLRQLLEESEHRYREVNQLREEEKQRWEESDKRQKEAKQQVEPTSLFGLLDACHSLSQALCVDTHATLTTRDDPTIVEKKRFPRLIRPWSNFPTLQEKVWDKLNGDPAFTSARLFPSSTQLQYVLRTIKNHIVYSEDSLRRFQNNTVDTFVEEILSAMAQNETLRRQFHIQERMGLQDRPDAEHSALTPLPDVSENVYLGSRPHRTRQRARGRRGRGRGSGHGTQKSRPKRRRTPRADQSCIHLAEHERRTPVYAVEFKAPHKLTLPEITAGLHEMDIAQDVIGQQGDTFEFHATHLVATVLTQLFSYMLDSAYIFVQIPANDPTILEYYLSIPKHDTKEEEFRLHRTAVGQILSFTLNALMTETPSQEWHDVANKSLSTWKVEYIDVLRDIPETIRKEPPPSNYRPSHWKRVKRSPYKTRTLAYCRSNRTTPRHSSGESSESDNNVPSPSPNPKSIERLGSSDQPPVGERRQEKRKRGSTETAMVDTEGLNKRQTSRPYCTTACMRGLLTQDQLDPKCPNVHEHGIGRHPFESKQFVRQLHCQLLKDRESGFEQLHIRGRTGFILKATLLSHGYTVIIKATSAQQEASLQKEIGIYHHLRGLQGNHIPVRLGGFRPGISYWYHGQRMTLMMVLGWSGVRVQKIINKENEPFFRAERRQLREVLQPYGVLHGDLEWRNMLWNSDMNRAFMIDFEDVKKHSANDSSDR
ncbi:hypothetical protein BDV25DRAFT_169850 [Aspergillus avenaceus]|uniref:Aminoglycoside phosphotransferase domain-containing protein n=1 Tax=Aspergillus avenaceus TaxID=36643 RepID=A0A5N6TJG2_ASPAV|nr:hypothetical protein BDV25DRAFT_169850 [Aspergillus avenaceus]